MTDNQKAAAAGVSVAVQTSDLKDKFRARSIPLEKDFHDLIDMADAGRLAAGLSPAQGSTNAAATTGLTIGADKRLGIKLKTGGGLDVEPGGVSVKKGNGIDATVDELTVKAAPNAGVVVSPDGVAVKANSGAGVVTGPDGIGMDSLYVTRLMAIMLGGADFCLVGEIAILFVKVIGNETHVEYHPVRGQRTTRAGKIQLDGRPPLKLYGMDGTDTYESALFAGAAKVGSILEYSTTAIGWCDGFTTPSSSYTERSCTILAGHAL